MIYFVTTALLIIGGMLFKRDDEKKRVFPALCFIVFTYFVYLTTIAGIMSIVHIPVNIYSISAANVLVLCMILIRCLHKKSVQAYYVELYDCVFVISLVISVFVVFIRRYGSDFSIVFETSDPATHLKMAMNTVNDQSVSGMYTGQLLNGLMIEALDKWNSCAYVYRSFLIQYGINFFFAGFIFWSLLRKYAQSLPQKALLFIITFAYLFGYPYNDLLYGFVYLQISISLICFLFMVWEEFIYAKHQKWMFLVLVAMTLYSIGVSYTLFVPITFISTFLALYLHKMTQGELNISNRKYLSKAFIFEALALFAIPALMILWYTILEGRFLGESSLGQALALEGSIYRNLYGDFILYCIPTLYAICVCIKKRRTYLWNLVVPVFLLYYILIFAMMYKGTVSTYYFYKLNYLLWLIMAINAFWGMKELFVDNRMIYYIYLLSSIGLFVIYATNIEQKLREKNSNISWYKPSTAFFQIYEINKQFENQHSASISNSLVEISNRIWELNIDNQDVYFIGYWIKAFWFEAFTNMRLPYWALHLTNYQEIFDKCIQESDAKYFVLEKSLEDIDYADFIQNYYIVYENDFGYIFCIIED